MAREKIIAQEDNIRLVAREKIIAQENNIRLVAMERQCGGTMKLLENYSNMDLTGNLNLELLEPGTLCKVV